MKCLNCGIEFKSQRATAQFHNAACRVAFNRKKLIEALPGYIKPESSQSEINKKVEEVKAKVKKRMDGENKGIEFIKGGDNGLFDNGELIAEEDLNYAYRGQKGKLELAQDLVYAAFFRVPKILLTEKERLEMVEKRKDSPPEKKIHLEVEKPEKTFQSTKLTFGGVTRDHRVHFMTPSGPISFPLNT